MWPWSHAVVGYVAYTLVVVAVRRRTLRGTEAIAAVVGTQVPDLIDKPLAWTLAVLPGGRSLGHSLFTWVLVSVLLLVVARRLDRSHLAPAVAVGYLTGILTDLQPAVLDGDFSRATFLLWPVLPSPESDVEPSLLANLGRLQPGELEQVVLLMVALVGGHLLLSRLRPDEPVNE